MLYYSVRPYRLIVRTQASQAWNPSAILGKVTKAFCEFMC